MKTCLAALTFLLLAVHPVQAQNAPGPIIGIGTELGSVEQRPTIVNVVPGTPADKAGVKSGDRIMSIDDYSVVGLTLIQISHRLRGAEGSPVRVTVQRHGSERTFEMKRAVLLLPASPSPQ